MKFIGPVTGTGQLLIQNNASIEVAGSLAAGQQVEFAGTLGQLLIDNAAQFAGSIKGLGTSAVIDLTGFAYSASAKLSFTPNGAGDGGVLGLSAAGTNANLTLAGSFSNPNGFSQVSDGHGGTLLSYKA